MDFNKKSQIWYFDFVMGVTIFTLILIVAFRFVTSDLYIPGKDTNSVLAEAEKLSETLLTPGIPTNWTEDTVSIPGIVDEGNILNIIKLEKLINLSNKGSNKVKQLFGIKSDFLVYFEDKDGNILWGFDNFKVSEESLTDNLVGVWTMDDDDVSGGTLLEPVNSLDATISGSTTGQTNCPDNLGECFYHDGGSDTLIIPDDPLFDLGTGDFTVSLWFNSTASAQNAYYIDKYSGGAAYWDFGVLADDRQEFVIFSDAFNVCAMRVSQNIRDGQWHHLLYTRNGTDCNSNNFHMWIDNTEKTLSFDNAKGTMSMSTATGDVTICSDRHGRSACNGFVDQLLIYNRAINSNEIDRLYNSGNGLTYPFTSAQNLSSVNDIKAANPEKLITITRYLVYKHDGISEIIAMKVVLWQE